MISTDMLAVANHLWQSTPWAGVMRVLSFALRKSRAAVRYRLWLAASAKFLIPFSLFVSIGSHLGWRTVTGIRAVGVPVSAPSQLVHSRVHRNVIDETGLSGLFDFHLGFNAPPPGLHEEDDPDGFALATTELRKLALGLKSTTGDAEIVVTDHIERPAQN